MAQDITTCRRTSHCLLAAAAAAAAADLPHEGWHMQNAIPTYVHYISSMQPQTGSAILKGKQKEQVQPLLLLHTKA